MSKNYPENKIIVLGSDHNGVTLKQQVIEFLKPKGYCCIDLGPYKEGQTVDYVDYANQLGQIIEQNSVKLGILICGTGVGMCMTVNKYSKVRGALVHNIETSFKSREHNDANVLCLGAWINKPDTNLQIVSNWLNEPFGEGRHVRRVEKIAPHSQENIVFTNGVFDVLHSGHIELLRFAKNLGGKLIIGLNSDKTTKILKGKDRPINHEQERKKVLESIGYVDEVIIMDDESPSRLINQIKPAIVVKGGEWTKEEVRKRDGIPDDIDIKIFPLVKDYSTTNILKTIKERQE